MPDHAVYILDPAAISADQMVMVVANSCFVKRRGIRRFDAAYQAGFEQGIQVIVHRLTGKAAEALTGNNGNGIGIQMPAFIHRPQHRESGGGNPHPCRPQAFLEQFDICIHIHIINLNLEFVNKKTTPEK